MRFSPMLETASTIHPANGGVSASHALEDMVEIAEIWPINLTTLYTSSTLVFEHDGLMSRPKNFPIKSSALTESYRVIST